MAAPMRSLTTLSVGVVLILAASAGCQAPEPTPTPISSDSIDLGSTLQISGGAVGTTWLAPGWLTVGHRDGGPVALISSDGRSWLEIKVEQGQEGTMSLAGVAATTEGAVAVGSIATADGPRAVSWTFEDSPGPTVLLREDGIPRYLYAVASHAGTVIAGGMQPFGANGETTGELWRLVDGSWQSVLELPRDSFNGSSVRAIGAAAGRWIAAGGETEPLVLRSADGETWSTEESDHFPGGTQLRGAAITQRGALVAGCTPLDDGGRIATAWVQRPGEEQWLEVALPGAAEGSCASGASVGNNTYLVVGNTNDGPQWWAVDEEGRAMSSGLMGSMLGIPRVLAVASDGVRFLTTGEVFSLEPGGASFIGLWLLTVASE